MKVYPTKLYLSVTTENLPFFLKLISLIFKRVNLFFGNYFRKATKITPELLITFSSVNRYKFYLCAFYKNYGYDL
jgi:hypothetical protein